MKKAIQIFKNIPKIFEGILNYFLKEEHIEEIAEARLVICAECPLVDRTGEKCLIPGTQPCCGECGCKLALKARSLSSECPHPDGPRWKAEMTEEEQDKLYKRIDYDPERNAK